MFVGLETKVLSHTSLKNFILLFCFQVGFPELFWGFETIVLQGLSRSFKSFLWTLAALCFLAEILYLTIFRGIVSC